MQLFSFPSTTIAEADFSPLYILSSFVKDKYPYVHGCISGLPILLHWSIFLHLCQHYTVLMTVALQYSLNSRRLIPPTLFSFLTIVLVIWGLLCFYTYCGFFFFFALSYVKNTMGSLRGIALTVQIALGSTVIFIVLILPVQEHGDIRLCHL